MTFLSNKTKMNTFSLKNKFFILMVLSCLIYLMLFMYNTVKSLNYLKITRIENCIDMKKETVHIDHTCLIPNLNAWDPKIKDMFENLPIYSNCTKSEPFTYVVNKTIYFNSNVNKTFYNGLI